MPMVMKNIRDPVVQESLRKSFEHNPYCGKVDDSALLGTIKLPRILKQL
jgi:hypothetical protein